MKQYTPREWGGHMAHGSNRGAIRQHRNRFGCWAPLAPTTIASPNRDQLCSSRQLDVGDSQPDALLSLLA